MTSTITSMSTNTRQIPIPIVNLYLLSEQEEKRIKLSLHLLKVIYYTTSKASYGWDARLALAQPLCVIFVSKTCPEQDMKSDGRLNNN